MELPNATMEEWLSGLKPYQANSIYELLENNNPDETIRLWLSANGPNSTIQFGGAGRSPEPFLDRFREEFRKFICGDEAYASYRAQLVSESPVTKTIYISVISAALGATLGSVATLLAPAVAIMLHLVCSMGINAWCSAS
ncbi:hypothetical protein [Aeromonas dhakensis]|uniref:hypothetical protein n=1 Tax=Aeromonas dhakensis TaxID=196024 RepID=UPI0028911096|nr:hypothetical protein [Aeromonas dhakensis]HDX9008789.1 hypothetical protein [Aeromonas dhakensis]